MLSRQVNSARVYMRVLHEFAGKQKTTVQNLLEVTNNLKQRDTGSHMAY